MVICEDLKEDFFDKIVKKRILIIASNGVDSVCTFKIIQRIFKNRNISFSYSLIKSKDELKTSFMKYGSIDNVLLINCGSLIDVVDFLEIGDSRKRVIYILDSQRPIHVHNFYNSTQVKILTLQENFDYVPVFDTIFSNEDDEEEDESDSYSEDQTPKRRRLDHDYLDARIRKREWKKQREDIMYQYEAFSFHGTSSSLVAYHLSCLINQDCMDLLWTAIVGHTSQFIFNFIKRDTYCMFLDMILSHLTKLTANRIESRETSATEISIEHIDEFMLWLYRHWSLEKAIYYSPVTMKAFQLCFEGKTLVRDFLGFIGISLERFRKNYFEMKQEVIDEISPVFRQQCQRYNIAIDDLYLPSFTAHRGFMQKISPIDATFAIAAMLDNIYDSDFSQTFLRAVDFLCIKDNDLINDSLGLAKDYVTAMYTFTKKSVQTNKALAFAGAFIKVVVPKTSDPTLRAPLIQYLLSRYVLEAVFAHNPTMKNIRSMPLILCTENFNKGTKLHLYGIPPLKSDKAKNSFGKIFDSVLEMMKSSDEQDDFDTCRILIENSHSLKYFMKIKSYLVE